MKRTSSHRHLSRRQSLAVERLECRQPLAVDAGLLDPGLLKVGSPAPLPRRPGED
jgi:hypothetical protein